jgi:hypothetical protein
VIVNGPSSHGCIGLGNGLTPSLTLACGPAGGATTTDNITYRNLMQVTRVARSSAGTRPGAGRPVGAHLSVRRSGADGAPRPEDPSTLVPRPARSAGAARV